MVQIIYSWMAETLTIQILEVVTAICLHKKENKEKLYMLYFIFIIK